MADITVPLGGVPVAGDRIILTVPGGGPVTPPPPPPPNPTYAATYTAHDGDETQALKTFIEGNRGKRVALVGQIGVTSCQVTLGAGEKTIVDFLGGAALRALISLDRETLYLNACFDADFNDARVVGRGFGAYDPALQGQAGIGIFGGGRINFNRPSTTDTFGDGIYIGVNSATQAPPVAVAINGPVIRRAQRNGISPLAGQVSIVGGLIDQTGLHGIDGEPNDNRQAVSLDVRVSGMRITRPSAIPVFDVPGQVIKGRAMSFLGGPQVFGVKRRVDIQGCSADVFEFAADYADQFVFVGNHSDVPVSAPARTAFYWAMNTKQITGNTGITLVEYNFRG